MSCATHRRAGLVALALPIVVRSAGPNQSTTHCTRLDWSRLPAACLPIPSRRRWCPAGRPGGRRPSAPDADVVGIEVVLGGVGPQPADRRLAVFDLRGEDGVLAEAVVDAGHGVALGGQRHGGAVLLAAGPATPRRESRRPPAAGPRPFRADTGQGGSARGRPRRIGGRAGPSRPPASFGAAGFGSLLRHCQIHPLPASPPARSPKSAITSSFSSMADCLAGVPALPDHRSVYFPSIRPREPVRQRAVDRACKTRIWRLSALDRKRAIR